jgi:hypothetical protein
MRFLLRLLITAAALWVAVKIVPGISYTGEWVPFLGVALDLRPRQRLHPAARQAADAADHLPDARALRARRQRDDADADGLALGQARDELPGQRLLDRDPRALVVSIVSALLSMFLVDAE